MCIEIFACLLNLLKLRIRTTDLASDKSESESSESSVHIHHARYCPTNARLLSDDDESPAAPATEIPHLSDASARELSLAHSGPATSFVESSASASSDVSMLDNPFSSAETPETEVNVSGHPKCLQKLKQYVDMHGHDDCADSDCEESNDKPMIICAGPACAWRVSPTTV
jgi:hypothetical protein